MKICNMILTEKPQNISALSSGKIDKYEYMTGEEILPLNQGDRTSYVCIFTIRESLKNKLKRLKSKEKNRFKL